MGLTPHFSQVVIYLLKMNTPLFCEHLEFSYLSLFSHILIQFELSIFSRNKLIWLIELNA